MTDDVSGWSPADIAWWRAHDGASPSIVLRCAECKTTRVGVVKVDGAVVYLGVRTRLPETWVPNPPLAGATEADIRRLQTERDATTLRYSEDGKERLTKRASFGVNVFRLSGMGHGPLDFARCAVHGTRHILDVHKLCELATDLARHGEKQSLLV